MKIATWNVNSLKVRLPHVLQWLEDNPVDVLCLQETKLTDDKFPVMEIGAAGYQVAFTGQKTYNGVAILSKKPVTDIVKNNPLFPDEQQRIVAATVDNVGIVCAYVPNGQAVGLEKYSYKLDWLRSLTQWRQKNGKNIHIWHYWVTTISRRKTATFTKPGGMGRQRSRFATGTGCFPGIAGHRFHRRLPSFRTA